MQEQQPELVHEIAKLAIALILRADIILGEFQRLRGSEPTSDAVGGSPLIVHYTSDDTAYKILKHRDVWLFDATTSNDRDEHIHGIRCMWRTLRGPAAFGLLQSKAVEQVVGPLSDFTADALYRTGSRIRRRMHRHVGAIALVTCFHRPAVQVAAVDCRTVDALWMWREYGKDGRGAALVIGSAELDRSMRGRPGGVFGVHYDSVDQEALCRFFVVAVQELVDSRQRECWTKSVAGVERVLTLAEALLASDYAAALLPFLLKHSCFAYEREARLLYLSTEADSRPLVSADGRTGRSRYYVPWSQIKAGDAAFPVASVYFGPRARQTRVQREVHALCRQERIYADCSSLPYRAYDKPVRSIDAAFKEMRALEARATVRSRAGRPGTSRT